MCQKGEGCDHSRNQEASRRGIRRLQVWTYKRVRRSSGRFAGLAKFFLCSGENWSLVGSGDITLTVRAAHKALNPRASEV